MVCGGTALGVSGILILSTTRAVVGTIRENRVLINPRRMC